MKSNPYENGFYDFFEGYSESPYSPESESHELWQEGFMFAKLSNEKEYSIGNTEKH